MANRFTVSYRGRDFTIERAGQPTGAGPTWQVTQNGSPVTSFPVSPDDTSDSVREKALEWLRGNESRPAQDIGRQ